MGPGLLAIGVLVCGVLVILQCSRRHVESARRQQAVTLSSIGDAVISTDAAGLITFVNPEAERLTGWRSAEAIGRSLADVFHVINEETRETAEDPATTVLRTGEQQGLSNHTILIAKDGRETPIENKASPIRARDVMEGVVLLFRDCTARRRIEGALRDRVLLQEQLAKIAETAPGVICAFRMRPDGSSCFPYASDRIRDVYGLSPEQLAQDAAPALQLICAEDSERVRSSLIDAAVKGEIWDQEFRVNNPVKGLIWVEGRAMPEREPDGSVLWRGFLNDITERRELEAQLRQAQKMESVGLLAGGVAHDFNNALTVIIGSTEMLVDTLPPQSAAAEMLGEIAKAADRAASLTRQLLAFSRKEIVAPRVIDLNAIVSDTEKMLRRLLREDVELIAALDPKIGVVKIDPGQWSQVLMNLAVNARDSMQAGGTLKIETSSAQREGRRFVRLTVTDTGCGMSPEVLSRIFEPFFTTKGVGQGTGLGLAVVYGIVKQSGGLIDVRSEPNVGTTFSILLPVANAELEVAAETHNEEDADGSETILVVEDEASLRRMVVRALRTRGYAVLEASNGSEALQVLDDHPNTIDMLMTDVVMPGMDGRELAEKVRGRCPDIRVLFVSGYTEDAIVHGGVRASSVSFLQKPYTPSALVSKLRKVLDSPAAGTA